MRRVVCAALMFGLLSTGCAGSDEPTGATGRAPAAASENGCRWDCPRCRPNQPCMLRPCVLVCPPGTTKCGDRVCGAGEVCCNASCGICTQPDMGCIQIACASTKCTSDLDCRTHSNYCGGCTCDALLVTEPDPICTTSLALCIADPCMGKTAACVGGTCKLQSM